MDGFKQGAEYYAKEKGKDVKVVGWDGKDKGSFTGGFEANETATNTARQLLDQDVDVILPVGGPIYQGALTAIADSGNGRRDDRCGRRRLRDRPQHPGRDPHLDPEEHEGLDLRGDHGCRRGRDLDFTPYIGTLENDGVGLAPFHNFEDKVSDTVADELEQVKAGIIDGSIPVTSYLQAP